MDEKLRKEVRILKAYAILSSLLFAVLIFAAFRSPKVVDFDQINAHRINIRETNGTIRLAISNTDEFPGGTIGGVELKYRNGHRGAGLLFYNDDGDENGGLVYETHVVNGVPEANSTIRFDHFRQQEAVGLNYEQQGTTKESGLMVWDQPNAPLTGDMARDLNDIQTMKDTAAQRAAYKAFQQKYDPAFGHFTQRVFVGRTRNDEAAVVLNDTKGKARVRLAVDSANHASLQFLDDSGKVVYRLPNDSTRK
ncbi:MAG TPA: hypothetical protein VGR59_14240 [Gemmatimonadaceae bacterium]|nr:hypothetical protein [Gemmatimonadaceae bacterium]